MCVVVAKFQGRFSLDFQTEAAKYLYYSSLWYSVLWQKIWNLIHVLLMGHRTLHIYCVVEFDEEQKSCDVIVKLIYFSISLLRFLP